MIQMGAQVTRGEHARRVLSVQSHTVFGYVGNKAAVFPLQLHGFDVDPVNTCHLSNHRGYSVCRGQSLNSYEFDEIAAGLEQNRLLHYDYVLTGYVREADIIKRIAALVTKIKARAPAELNATASCAPVYICDPVLGDHGRLYVPNEVVDAYKAHLLPIADVVTPNQFELETLAGMKVQCGDDVVEACRRLHQAGPREVIATGISHTPEILSLFASRAGHSGEPQRVYRIDLRELPRKFSGCGDLCAALVLAWRHHSNGSLPETLEKVTATLQSILEATMNRNASELQIVGCKDIILNPPCTHAYSTDAGSSSQTLSRNTEMLRQKEKTRLWRGAYTCDNGLCGVIFDLDGTLTAHGHIDFKRMRDRIGLLPGEDLIAQVEGLPPAERTRAYEIIYDEEMEGVKRMQIRADLHETLNELERLRIRVAIATRNNMDAVQVFLREAGLSHDHFHPILTRDFVFNKPSPKVATHITEGWRISPSKVMFVGDSEDDMLCGRSAGCRTVLIRTPNALSSDSTSDATVTNLREVVDLLIDQRWTARIC